MMSENQPENPGTPIPEDRIPAATPPDAVPEAARAVSELPHLRLLGLMTSAPYTEDPETNRLFFRALRELAYRLSGQGLILPSSAGFRTPVLSMGMSGDYAVAVEEGATMVRVGTSIFGRRHYA